MTRPPITPDRMLGEAGRAQVIYRSDSVHPRHQANFRVFDPLDFLAEVSAQIPDPHEKTTLFYGWYSNRTRGYRRQHGLLGKAERAEPLPDEATRAPLEVRRSCLRRAQTRRARPIRLACCPPSFIPHSEFRTPHSYDPLLCPQCGGTMKVIAVIERPAVIRQILDHLGLPTAAPHLRAPPDPPDALAAQQPREWSYEPVFDDLLSDPLLL